MVKSYTTEAIIINRFNYSEADKILTLFTKDHGKLTAIAKGLRKPQSKRKGHLELFNHIRCQLIGSHAWDILTEVETISNFTQNMSNVNGQMSTVINSAYHFAELIDRLLPSHEPHPDIFDLLSKTLHSLCQMSIVNGQMSNIDSYFKHRLIRSLGFWPSDHTVPTDINAFIDSLLERPLKTSNGSLFTPLNS